MCKLFKIQKNITKDYPICNFPSSELDIYRKLLIFHTLKPLFLKKIYLFFQFK